MLTYALVPKLSGSLAILIWCLGIIISAFNLIPQYDEKTKSVPTMNLSLYISCYANSIYALLQMLSELSYSSMSKLYP